MLRIHNLYKTILMLVCLGSYSFAASDTQILNNSLCIIESQNMQNLSKQEYVDAWENLANLVEKGVGATEAKKIISTTVDRYKDLWKNISFGSFGIRFDISLSRHFVMKLATCCVKQGCYYVEAIELLQLMKNYIDAQEYVELVDSLLDTEFGSQELEKMAREEILNAGSMYRIDKALTIYRCFVYRNLFIKEAFLAVEQTLRHCNDGMFGIFNNHYIMETAFQVLIALVDKGYFIDDTIKILSYHLNHFYRLPMTELHDLFMYIADNDSHKQDFLQLMKQALSSNDARERECMLNALAYIVGYNGQWLDEAYQAATQAFSDNNEDVRCAASQLFVGLAYGDACIYDAISFMHQAETDENSSIRDDALKVRCILAARGYMLAETFALAKSETIEDDDALELYQALVESGHYMHEALDKVKQIIQQNDNTMDGVLALLTSLFLQGYEMGEVKICATTCMKKLGHYYNYEHEFSKFAYKRILAKRRHDLAVFYRLSGEEMENFNVACKLFFEGLFASPDLAHIKESCEKALCKEIIDPTKFTDILFLEESDLVSWSLQSLKTFASRKWISYGNEGMPSHIF